jgi:hypothetical protein
MGQFDASQSDSSYVQCAVCDKVITGGNWFARIRHGDWLVALCCPLCTEVFERSPLSCIRRIETLSHLRNPASDSPAK